MSPPIVRCRAVTFGHGRHRVLQGVDLAIGPGECWFLLGPNGAGKSTLLRALLGIDRPLAGAIERDPAVASPRHLGFVPQRCDLNPSLPTTVREFVALGRVGLRQPRAEAEDAVRWALDVVGLLDVVDRDYWRLSGGQRQRALVARALARRPRWLVLDEPTNGLDLASADSLLAGVARLHRTEGLTVVFVTHELALATRHASHVALFRNGGVLAGPRDAVCTSVELTRTYGVPVAWPVGDRGAGA